MKTNKKHLLPVVGIFLLAGCTTTRYVEQVTYPSHVASPVPQTRAQIRPLTASLMDGNTIERDYSKPVDPVTKTKVKTPANIYSRNAAFSKTYKRAKKPKIALFLYRELTSGVLDHESPERLVFAGQYNKNKGNLIIAKQNNHNIDKGSRYLGSNDWSWRFEDKMMNALLASGVKLVDRATIMRLVAAKEERCKDSTGMLSVKKIEMDALKGYADILLEVLVYPAKNKNRMYDVRLMAKKIKTGDIIATVSATSIDLIEGIPEEETVENEFDKIVPIGSGNRKVIKQWPVEKTALWVSERLKNNLANYWSAHYL
jgi:hypothetical protein